MGVVRNPAEISRWMREQVGKELGVPADSLDPTESFESYGLDSITGFTLTCDLAEWLNVDLRAELLWEYPTIARLAEHLGQNLSSESSPSGVA